jgi:hypothetical protein
MYVALQQKTHKKYRKARGGPGAHAVERAVHVWCVSRGGGGGGSPSDVRHRAVAVVGGGGRAEEEVDDDDNLDN